MSTRDQVLKCLEENKGSSVSGESLASMLGISRSAVWKAVTDLRKEGHSIEALTNKGYCLAEDSDLLSVQGMAPYLNKPQDAEKIHLFKTVGSTNDVLKKMAMEGASEGTLVISEQQTKGKGRRGRSFFSPANSGIYMSILLKPHLEISNSVLITTAASVAVCRAIEAVTGLSAEIKWVNDVYLNGKKICGILTEAVTDVESGQIQHLVLGIGVNCFAGKDIPKELSEIIGVLNIDNLSRNQLAAEVYNQVLSLSAKLDSREFLEEYKARSLVLGKEIRIYKAGTAPAASVLYDQSASTAEFTSAAAVDIDGDGGLVVKYEDGSLASLHSGEITIRLK